MQVPNSYQAGRTHHAQPISDPMEVGVQTGDASRANLTLKLGRWALRLLFRVIFRVKVRRLQKLPKGPVIICANHLGWTDPFLILLFLPVEPRIYVVGEREVSQLSSFRNRALHHLQVMVPLDREKPREALDTMKDVLQRGGSLLLFPEGHLGEKEGALGELKHGAAHLAVVSGHPIVPVGLTGTSELWLGRKLTMRVGQAIDSSGLAGDSRDRIRAMTASLDTALRGLLPGDEPHPRWKPLRRWLTDLL
jgi:1-acyl-sn-glycerol-3-phosphate acyltransferase